MAISPPSAVHQRLAVPRGLVGAAWTAADQTAAAGRIIHHRHRELEANLVLRGGGSYLVGAQQLRLRAGSLVWLLPGRDHCLIERSHDFSMLIAVWTPQVLARERPPALPEGPTCRTLPLPEVRALARLIEDLAGCRQVAVINRGLVFLLWRLQQAYADAPPAPTAADLDPRVAEIAHLLATPAGGTMDAAALSRRAGLHPDHLARRFRAGLGMSIGAYRTRLRLERVLAAWTPGGNLLELALAAGFGSYTQFHRDFTAQFGMPPRRWLDARG